MSVVNKMLNDLEQRESNNIGSHDSYRPPEPQKNTKRIAFYAVFSVSVLAATAWLLISEPKSERKITPIAPNSSLVNGDKDKQLATNNEKPTVSETETIAAPSEEASVVEASVDSAPAELIEEVAPALESEVEPQVLEEVVPAEIPEAKAAKLAVSPSNGEQKTRHQMLVANALASNDRETAKTALRNWLSEQPDNLEARKKLAALYFSDGQISEAESMLVASRQSHPNDPSVRLMQARFYMQSGKSEDAWDTLQLESSDPNFLHYRAALARQLNNLVSAEQDYSALTRLTPLDIKGWLGLAVVSESLGKTTDAMSAFVQVLRMSEGNEQIRAFANERLAVLREKQ